MVVVSLDIGVVIAETSVFSSTINITLIERTYIFLVSEHLYLQKVIICKDISQNKKKT